MLGNFTQQFQFIIDLEMVLSSDIRLPQCREALERINKVLVEMRQGDVNPTRDFYNLHSTLCKLTHYKEIGIASIARGSSVITEHQAP